MTLELHRAARTDVLADGLAALLATPLPDPFAQELVVVPAKGVERWLSQRLSHRLGPSAGGEDGVCAGVEFTSPYRLVARLTDREHDDDPWRPDALAWPVLAAIDAAAGQPWARVLDRHLGIGRTGAEADQRRGRRYAVARRLARLFASYAAQRPSLLADWEAGRDTDGAGGPLPDDLGWQPVLWRRVVADRGLPTPGDRHAEARALLEADPAAFALPPRISIFGPTRLPANELDLLASLARHRDVHVWLPHPSPALWAALADLHGRVPRTEDRSQRWVHHPLLASLGRDVRETERELRSRPELVDAATAPPEEHRQDLLGRLQADIAANRAPDPRGRALDAGDDSVRVHACHGPARQVEVLREEILGLLEDDPTLEPRDIVVMCPDIEAYAPLLVAAFGLGERDSDHPAHRLQVRLADRSLTQTNPVLAVIGTVLNLAGGRAEASRVLDLFAQEPVRRRFGFSGDDLETAARWVEQAGIRWAFDEEHREDFGLAGYVQNTWRFGLDRLLAGVAVSDDADRYFGPTLPLDDVASSAIDLAGRLAECVDRVRRLTDGLTGSRPVADWFATLTGVVEQLCETSYGEEWQLAQAHRELAVLAQEEAEEEGALELRLADVRALLGARLSGRPTRANFRTGSLTVATLVPMRSVPHRVVCLLGLDDGVFPRSGATDGDDVLVRRPLTGERDPRSEDRQLLLDAVMAAGEHLVVTYSGAHETTGADRPPAVPLGELLDALDATAPGGKEHALIRHPLQDFDPRNFAAGRPVSFDPAALAGARASLHERREPATLAELWLPPVTGDVDLDELTRFFRAPVRELLRSRLEITLPDEGEEVLDGIPVELDGLTRWGAGDRMLRDLMSGHTGDQARQREWRRGVLPPGRLGWRQSQQVLDEAAPIAERVIAARAGLEQHAVDIDLDLGDGRRLQGTVAEVYGDRVVQATFSRIGPRHHLDAWIPLLALCAQRPGLPWSAGVAGKGGQVAFTRVEDPLLLLRRLVEIRDTGLRGPLPLPLKTGFAYAEGRRPEVAVGRATKAWERDKYSSECEDAAHVRVWGPVYPFTALDAQSPLPEEEPLVEATRETGRFRVLARALWQPILDHRRLS